ncbi:MAG: LCP family protein [Erysipelotrichaceae bacterium]
MKQKNNRSKKRKRVRYDRLFLLLGLSIACVVGMLWGSVALLRMGLKSFAQDRNVVILGVDARATSTEASRSDALMVVHVDVDASRVDLISIPRDSYVPLACSNRQDKITHAYAYGEVNWEFVGGGVACSMQTLSSLFEVRDFKDYVVVDFTQLIALVDVLGGIKLTPTASFCEMDENDKKNQYCFVEGETQTLDGGAALAYARHRKSDSDVYRAARQQEVLLAMLSKVQSASLIQQVQFGLAALRNVDTNLSLFQLVPYLSLLDSKLTFQQTTLSGSDGLYYNEAYQGYSYAYIIDQEHLRELQEIVAR